MYRIGIGRRRGSGFVCQCGDWTTYDESADCNCCGNIFCEECADFTCDICKAKDPDGLTKICESCIAYPGCEKCGSDVTICNECIRGHLEECSKKGRAERIIGSETQSISENEIKITKLRELIASKQAELNYLESQVKTSRERKAQAEAELKAEEEEEEQRRKKQRAKY
mmetsp:Transcript_26561/g.56127  ORF Transcript_26561/g.56127 Transcript_26561/m.56127 type:complete len:169 (+) Transcript_26561:133-639(+)|eukprot:CAMPEP_0183736874 /NCGR_PEP_ID=MMETSP0737-20130205/50476_1 /TAXON_ID=385413 /ORGANISM="Thalassiosira miniscula, Strain CCMP1093" /LENGTH=168 /DNA_ID=CAMNT_0025971001 /DNA_START=58 /DNA_END=564 /DNA_ORIENTATION=+